MLMEMLTEPARALIENTGRSPEPVLGSVRQAGAGFGFDVTTGEVCAMLERGIVDASAVLKVSVETAVSIASALLSAQLIVDASRHR